MAKTTCPITRAQFHEGAQAIPIKIGKEKIQLIPREFSTGSFGWRADGKIPVEIDGKVVVATLGLNLIALGSKDAS
jgi:hypothetical protein